MNKMRVLGVRVRDLADRFPISVFFFRLANGQLIYWLHYDSEQYAIPPPFANRIFPNLSVHLRRHANTQMHHEIRSKNKGVWKMNKTIKKEETLQ